MKLLGSLVLAIGLCACVEGNSAVNTCKSAVDNAKQIHQTNLSLQNLSKITRAMATRDSPRMAQSFQEFTGRVPTAQSYACIAVNDGGLEYYLFVQQDSIQKDSASSNLIYMTPVGGVVGNVLKE